MTLKQLEYVVKVAECGTVSGAAKALFVAQPSLSAAIQELESEMHLTLFHRTNKGVIVTKEGEVFLSYARQILEQTALLDPALFLCGERLCGPDPGAGRRPL